MGREVVSIHLGGCGSQLGLAFWEGIAAEHGIDPSGHFFGDNDFQLEKIDVFFRESQKGRYIPRAVFADYDSKSSDQIKSSQFGELFSSDSFFSEQKGGQCIFPNGNQERTYLFEESFDQIRLERERCDSLQALQFSQSLSGGTGSGFGNRLLSELHNEGCGCCTNVIVFPSSSNINFVEAMNTVLSLENLSEMSYQVNSIDNDALNQIASNHLHIQSPTYHDLNKIVARTLTDLSSGYRFPGAVNTSIRKMMTNVISYPRTHFLATAYSPFLPNHPGNVDTLLAAIINPQNYLISLDLHEGYFFGLGGHFRGLVSPGEVGEKFHQFELDNPDYFAKWCLNHFSNSYTDIPTIGFPATAVYQTNTLAIRTLWRTLSSIASKFKKFAHQYSAAGLTEIDLQEAHSNICDIISAYELYGFEPCAADEGDEEEEDV